MSGSLVESTGTAFDRGCAGPPGEERRRRLLAGIAPALMLPAAGVVSGAGATSETRHEAQECN
jgi:hypothetical protein